MARRGNTSFVNLFFIALFAIGITAIIAGFVYVWIKSPQTAWAIQVVITLATVGWFLYGVKSLEGFFSAYKFFISLVVGVLFFFLVLLPMFGIWAIAIGIGVSMVVMVADIEGMKKRIQERK